MHNIAFIGKARSGKDTAALHLVRTRAYTRLAFADPLKEMCIRIDPVVPTTHGVHVRLSTLIRDVGWEYAKDTYPEVRRMLQRVGQAQREFDEDYWVNALRRKLNNAEAWNLPVVVTDVRYRNEADMLRSRGFKLVRIIRPEAGAKGLAAQHDSETELDGYPTDAGILNDGSLTALYERVANL